MSIKTAIIATLTADELIREFGLEGDPDGVNQVAGRISRALDAPGAENELGREVVAALMLRAHRHGPRSPVSDPSMSVTAGAVGGG